jgi:hypothetical protein
VQHGYEVTIQKLADTVEEGDGRGSAALGSVSGVSEVVKHHFEQVLAVRTHTPSRLHWPIDKTSR